MSFDYINEAFKQLNILEEDVFEPSTDGVNKLDMFLDNDDDTINVIDPEATSEEELNDSYIGKVIINCNVCHSHIFKAKEDIEINEEGVVNSESECPYCGEQEGFTVIGEITPYVESKEEEPSEDEVNAEVEVDGEEIPAEEEPVNESLTEAMNNVNVETDDTIVTVNSDENGKVTVSTEPKVEDTIIEDEMIAPISDETINEIEANQEPAEAVASEEEFAEEEFSEDEYVEDETTDVDIEEVDEDSMDELGESYIRNIYDNVSGFRTTNVSMSDTKMIIEGLITFTSGTQKKTGFIFEAVGIDKNNNVRFVGKNSHFSTSPEAYTLSGKVNNNKLFFESLDYHYVAKDSAGKLNKIQGKVNHK